MASNIPSSASRSRFGPPSTPGAATATTPSRRAISADPTSGGRRSASARRPAAATPHARAAIRTIDQRRRTIFTPARARRRSLRDQRETPRDILRNLSRLLAPASQPVHSSSSSSPGDDSRTTLTPVAEGIDDDDDDDFPIERPRFSLPLREDDDDDSDLKAPRLSGLEDENFTSASIELPRRALSEGPSRLGRESLASLRFSDVPGPDIRSDDIAMDSGLFQPMGLEDDGGNDFRRQTLNRESLFGPIEIPEGVDETTFMMETVASPTREVTAHEGALENDEAPGMFDDDDDHVNEPMDYRDPEDYDDVPADYDDAPVDHDDGPDDDEDTPDDVAEDLLQNATVTSNTADLTTAFAANRGGRAKAGKKISKHGIEYPSLPKGVVKRLATTFAKTSGLGKAKLSADTLDAMMQATDWFFEQLGDDLSAYAKHAGRKTIDESDMLTLMRRQRQVGASATPFSLAQRYLPRELLQELRMPVPPPTRAPKKSKRVNAEEDDEAVT
ncbi:centromere kinetochore component CENP-T-domain-containing protein [Pestalotiopsis sp. NC0098]|nr:centromere kinetochore component CENP-T-domain-containing protein [Pestalotiopsis sp. NC0098]